MGIGPDVIALYSQLHRDGMFDDVKDVVELGDQEMMMLISAPVMKDCLTQFGRPDLTEEPAFSKICNGPSKTFYTSLGMNHVSLDTTGANDAHVFDLNFDTVGEDMAGRFDLLTNFGTAEHVFNQYNTFKCIHELVRKDGYFIHYMPFLGFVDHGYYSFQPVFYHELAAANDYEMIGLWINPQAKKWYLIPWTKSVLEDLSLDAQNFSALLCVMRKKEDLPFRVPFQGKYVASYAGENFHQKYRVIVDGTKQGIPSKEGYLKGISGYTLQRELLGRYWRAIKRRLGGD
jgi:hypothetical protein